MKQFLIIIVLVLSVNLYSQQVNLYDRNGNATAYIDFSHNGTIYTWDGKPVGFIDQKGNDYAVFSYNGNFIGWYDNGAIYDQSGKILTATENNLYTVPAIASIKGIQQIEPIRPVTPVVPVKPIFSNSWTTQTLEYILR